MGLETLAAIGVSAAGEMAGGYAASALMGNTAYPKGGGINGLTSANTGKSGISPAVQINPATALQYFQSAANSFQTQDLTGLNVYNQAMQQASSQLQSGYDAANQTLKPLSEAGTAATNEYMKMLGLNTESPTQGISAQVQNLGYSDLASQISAAENIQDPTARAAAKQSILQGFQNSIQQSNATFQSQGASAVAALGSPADIAAKATQLSGAFYDMNVASPERDQIEGAALDWQRGLSNSQAAALGGYDPNDPLHIKDYYMSTLQDQYNTNLANTQAQYSGSNNTQANNLTNLMNTYNNNYADNANYFGYSGQQVTDRIEATPGYNFQLNQGLEAIDRSAAAAGMLSSGNTLTAANDYAQNQADSYYNSYMNNLSNLMGMGNSATMQIAGNQAGLGTNLANLTVGGGQAALNTYQNIGQALYNSYTNSGNTWNSDMLANMQAQNAMIMQSNALKTQAGIASGQQNIAGGYLNLQAANQANSLNNQQAQANTFNKTMTLG